MHSRRGVTLVELLVVIAIIALLVALLLPAVQAARESSRRATCLNNRKQSALAILNHASAHDRLPGIWRPRGKVWQRSWRLTTLPFLEESALHDAMAEARFTSSRRRGRMERVESSGVAENAAVVSAYLCPSTPGTPLLVPDRQVITLQSGRRQLLFDGIATLQNAAISTVTLVSGGDSGFLLEKKAPGAWAGTAHGQLGGARDFGRYWKDGILPRLFRPARLNWISDGTSKTMLIHEQAGLPWHIDPFREDRMASNASNWLEGSTVHHVHAEESGLWLLDGTITVNDWTSPPRPAVNGSNLSGVFSFHPAGAHVAMCDGSVRLLSNDATNEILFALASRSGHDVTE